MKRGFTSRVPRNIQKPSCKFLKNIRASVVAVERPTPAAFPVFIVKYATYCKRARSNSPIDRCSGVLRVYAHGLGTGGAARQLTFWKHTRIPVALGLLEPKCHGLAANLHISTWRARNAHAPK